MSDLITSLSPESKKFRDYFQYKQKRVQGKTRGRKLDLFTSLNFIIKSSKLKLSLKFHITLMLSSNKY